MEEEVISAYTLVASIVTGVLALIATIFTGFMTYLTAQLNTKQVKTDEKLEVIRAQGNHQLGMQMLETSTARRALYEVTHDAKHLAAAEHAEKLYEKHQEDQRQIANAIQQKDEDQGTKSEGL